MTVGPLSRWPPSYLELRPPGRLRAHVASAWVYTVTPGGVSVLHHDIPDGTIDVRCKLGHPPIVVGPLTAPRENRLEPGEVMLGFRLRPGAAAALGLPAEELTDQVVETHEVLAGSVTAVAEAARPEDGLACLAEVVLSGCRERPATDPVVDEAIRRLIAQQDIHQIRVALDIPERSFRRRFRHAVGLGPKTLQQLLRFQALLGEAQRAAAAGEPIAAHGLAALAVEYGYADQPHLTRECVRITGRSPRVYFGDVERTCREHDHRIPHT